MASLRAAALQVRADHEYAAAACTADIRRATTMRFAEPPGWFAGLLDCVTDWITDHAPVLKVISAALKQISSLAGMLAMIPALAPIMAPIAVVSGGAAVVIDGVVMAATGEGSVTDLVLDGASMLPGARAAVAVGVVQTARAADRATQGDGSWADVLVSAASVVIGAKGGARGAPEGPRPHAHQDGAGGIAEKSSVGSRDDGPAASTDLPAGLPPGTEYIYHVGAARVPREWGPPIPNRMRSRGKLGLRWFGPNPSADGVRIDIGDPSSPFPSQRVDHIIVRSNNRVLLPDGTAVSGSGSVAENWQCHIPLSEWINWREWNRP